MTVDKLKALLEGAPGHYLVGVTDGDGVTLWPDNLTKDAGDVYVILEPRVKPKEER